MLFQKQLHRHSFNTFSYSNCSMRRQWEHPDKRLALSPSQLCQQWYRTSSRFLLRPWSICMAARRRWDCQRRNFWRICRQNCSKSGSRNIRISRIRSMFHLLKLQPQYILNQSAIRKKKRSKSCKALIKSKTIPPSSRRRLKNQQASLSKEEILIIESFICLALTIHSTQLKISRKRPHSSK